LSAASAVIYHHGREQSHTEAIYGETVTEADASHRAFLVCLDTLADFLPTQNPDAQIALAIFFPSKAALSRALDASPHGEQETSIESIRRCDRILRDHPNAHISLGWLPRTIPFVGFKRAKQLALEAIRTADATNLTEPNTIRSQKANAEERAIATLTERYYSAPHTSLIYRTLLTNPPDGKPHPAASFRTQNEDSQDKFSRLTYATLYRVATGHAFVGEYTKRFHPQHTPEQIACPCGEPVETVEHVLLHCPLYNKPRRDYLTVSGRPLNLGQIFKGPKRITAMLHFLEESGACAKPRATWEPD